MIIISSIADNDLRGFKVNDEIVVDKNVIGEFIKNSAKLTILNKNHQYDFLEKTYLNITNFGKWYVDNLNNDEESVEADLTLFDLSVKFDVDYEDTFSFPATLGEWANWIGNKVGVPLKGTFLNSDKQLTEKPYLGNNPKYRTAVKIIAKYASGWAEINEDETYSIRWFDDTTINIEDWENFKHGSTSDSVNIIILSTGVTEDNVRYPEQIPTNAHELRIEDDWLAIDRYTISKSIFEQVNGFSYTAITELTLPYGLLEFKVGQKIKTKDIELNEIESYISSHTLTWDGGDWNDPNSWTSTLKMDELKETTTKYQYSNSIENRVGKTEINCDKNNKQINMLVEDVGEIEKDITTSKTAEGNPIEIDDAGKYPLKSIKIEGKSQGVINYLKNEGKTTSMNGVTYTFNEDGSITIKGTATDTSYAMILGESLFDYSKERLKIETDYVASGWYNSNIRLIGRGTDSKYYNIYQGNVADIKNVPLSLVYIQVVTGATIDETIYPMISNKASSFIPPGTWLKLVSSNKNLFNSNDCITFNGHIANRILSYNSSNKVLVFPCAPNKKYAISKKSGDRFRIGSYPTFANKGITLNNYISNDNTNILTITTGSNDKYLYIEYWVNIEEASEKEIINSIQIETNEPTEYIAHEEHIALIDLNIYNDSGNIIAHHEINDGEIFKNGVLSKKDGEIHNLPYTILNINKGYNYVTLNDELYPNMEIEYLTDSKINADFVSSSTFEIERNRINSEIKNKVSDEELGQIIEEQTNKIEQTLNEQENKIDVSVSQKIEDIQIGGANLLKNSDFMIETTKSGGNKFSGNVSLIDGYDLNNLIGKNLIFSYYVKRTGASAIAGTSQDARYGMHALIEYVKSDGTKKVVYPFANHLTDAEINKRVAQTYKVELPPGYEGVSRFLIAVQSNNKPSDTNNSIWKLGQPKLEIGTKETDYSPAAEDKLDISKFTKAELILKITDGKSSIYLSADNIEADGLVTFMNNRLKEPGKTTINGANITTGTISCDRLFGGTIKGQNIEGGTITGSTIRIEADSDTDSRFTIYNKNDHRNNVDIVPGGLYLVNQDQRTIMLLGGVGGIQCNFLKAARYLSAPIISANGDISTGLTIHAATWNGVTAGENAVWISGDGNITLNPGGKAYIRVGTGTSHAIATSAGNESSLILKENIKKFTLDEYESAIELLKHIDIFNYDYKYNIYDKKEDNKNEFGFIIDYIEENINASKFFKFINRKAKITEENCLDEIYASEHPQTKKDIIEYKEYDDKVLLKYLLVVCKKQQEQIDELKDRVTKLEKERGNYEEIK